MLIRLLQSVLDDSVLSSVLSFAEGNQNFLSKFDLKEELKVFFPGLCFFPLMETFGHMC